ncbi:MAG: Lrp/AsnC family transcriptional regulator [Candidatus Heimdallarchaeota archaeon]|nr:MAG: Lrp/AsnC family transcriptional regulator [Candidatus Heimdallarchaeota archaeon]
MIYDEIDRQILEILNQDGRTKFTTIAKRIKRTEGTVRNRVRRLREKGVIQGFRVITDPENLGFERQAIIRFQMEPSYEAYSQLDRLPYICGKQSCKLLSLYRSNGESSFMLEVLSKNKQDLDFFVSELSKFNGIEDIEILVKEEKIYDHLS